MWRKKEDKKEIVVVFVAWFVSVSVSVWYGFQVVIFWDWWGPFDVKVMLSISLWLAFVGLVICLSDHGWTLAKPPLKYLLFGIDKSVTAVCVYGTMESGKSIVEKVLKSKGFHVFRFGDCLKQMAAYICSCSVGMIHEVKDIEVVWSPCTFDDVMKRFEHSWPHYPFFFRESGRHPLDNVSYHDIKPFTDIEIDKYGIESVVPKKGLTYGRLLQHLGDIVRKYNKMALIKLVVDKVKMYGFKKVAFTDCRVYGELNLAKKYDGFTIKVFRDDKDKKNNSKRDKSHVTETQLSKVKFDHTVFNDGTKEQLERRIGKIVDLELSKREGKGEENK